MFVFSFRYPKNIITDVLICLICILLIILVFQTEVLLPVSISMDNIDKGLSFLEDNGWIVEAEPDNSVYVVISSNQPCFAEYRQLQLEQGFDFDRIVGKRVLKVTFDLKEYPSIDEPEGYFANIYFYDGVIVAAEIISVSIDGFMEGVVSGKNSFR